MVGVSWSAGRRAAPFERGGARGHASAAAPGLYREKVAALEQALADPAIKAEAAEIIRSHIDRIALTPSEDGTLDIQL